MFLKNVAKNFIMCHDLDYEL